MPINIALVDDHTIFAQSLATLINTYPEFSVKLIAKSGKDLQVKLSYCKDIIDICIVDVIMPDMDGAQVAFWLRESYPLIKIIALSVESKEKTIVRMMRAGCCCYMLKDMDEIQLKIALLSVYEKGYYMGGANFSNTGENITEIWEKDRLKFTEEELIFIKLACTDYTYKEIASQMKVKERRVEAIREHMFEKLNVQSRQGLCLVAIRKGLVDL